MTDIEQKALALLRECVGNARWKRPIETINRQSDLLHEALCRAIERHETFKQKVSDAAEVYEEMGYPVAWEGFEQFIIRKPDPLVDAMTEAFSNGGVWEPCNKADADNLRAALEARGLEIREKGQ